MRGLLLSCPALFLPFYTMYAAKLVSKLGPEAAGATYVALAVVRLGARVAAVGVDIAALSYRRKVVVPPVAP